MMNSEERELYLTAIESLSPLERLSDPLFHQQQRFVRDESPTVAAVCTRRAGKSFGLGLRLFRAGYKHPDSTPLYVALTRRSAKSIMWPVMKKINRIYGLGATFNDSDLTAKIPNGSIISLVGADMENFIERLRGPSYPEAVIDEAASFRSHLKELIQDVLEPATMDYNGSIVLVGTPGVVPEGLFFDATRENSAWSRHFWTVYQNPYLPNAQAFVDRIKRERKWSDENPTYRREYLGEWAIDLDALVYKFKKEKNLYDTLPTGHDYLRVMAIDYGWNDASAFTIVSYSHTLREVFIEHAEGHSQWTPSQIAEKIQALRARFSPVKIVADTGGLGKSITEEMIRRYSIPIHAAEKKEKLTNIHLMNGDFIDGNLHVHRSLTDLQDQYLTLTKGDDGMEDPNLPNDLADGCLYAFREAKHYLGQIKEPDPQHGTEAWGQKEAAKMLAQETEQFEREQSIQWWER